METQYVNINDILIDDSHFSLKDYLFDSFSAPTCHITSFDTLGILYPVILFVGDRNRYHLVDGRKRLQFAKEMRQPMIKANILPRGTPLTDIITLIFCNKRDDIQASIINRVQFLCYALSLNASDSWILQSLCVPFEFKPHSSFLRECERIFNLPGKLRQFCHEKKFSLKQLLNLTLLPEKLLLQIIDWKSDLQLTASIMDEIASNLKDYLKRENKSIDDFVSGQDVQEIFDSSLSPREKTDKLRQLINLKRFPILSQKNSAIQASVDELSLPKGMTIDWDRSLENKNIHVSLNIRDLSKWQGLLETLSSAEVKKALESILDEL
jgi:hypothetical protein